MKENIIRNKKFIAGNVGLVVLASLSVIILIATVILTANFSATKQETPPSQAVNTIYIPSNTPTPTPIVDQTPTSASSAVPIKTSVTGPTPTSRLTSPITSIKSLVIPTATISASATSVAIGGSSTITWSSTNATACTVVKVADNSTNSTWGSGTSGSVTQSGYSTSGTKTYTITCTGSGGTSQPASATVSVNSAPAFSIETIIFKEQNSGELLVSSGNDWYVNSGKFLEQFYKIYADDYDFIIVSPTKTLTSHLSETINNSTVGINFENVTSTYTKKLLGLVRMDFYRTWELRITESLTPSTEASLSNSLMHEIAHHWGVFITGLGKTMPAHWTHNLDLFSGDSKYVDDLAYFHWIRKDGQDICVDINDPTKIVKFSNLTLYLMGFIPPEYVQPIYIHDFKEKSDNPHYNEWGPDCRDTPDFLGTRTITIDDIISANGARSPTSVNSQKDFIVAFVILTPKDVDAPQGFIDYVNKYKEALPSAWNGATNGKSHIYGWLRN